MASETAPLLPPKDHAGPAEGREPVATTWVLSLTGACAVIALPFVFGS